MRPRKRHWVTRIMLLVVSVELCAMALGFIPETTQMIVASVAGLGLAVAFDY